VLTPSGYRHEIAFVFGQLLSPHSVPALLQVLQNSKESDMVRHEAAEALGGIATPEVLPYLKEYMTREDAPSVVRESCQVALDMYEVGVSSFLWNTIMGLSSTFADHSTKIQTNFSMPMV
jgi:HEAT repeats